MTDERIEQLRRMAGERGGPWAFIHEMCDEIVRLQQVEKDAVRVIKQLSKKGRK